MPGVKNPLEIECVYISESTQGYVKANVNIRIGDDNTDIYVKPEHMITCGELNSVLSYLENGIIKKLGLNIMEECILHVSHNDITYGVELDKGKVCAIKGLGIL